MLNRIPIYRFLIHGVLLACLFLSNCGAFEANCPDSWTKSAYTGTCLKLIKQNKTWNEAEKHCVDLGGHLVKIIGRTMNELVGDLAKEGTVQTAYIGLRKHETERTFKWSKDGSDAPNFQDIEYSDDDFGEEECVSINGTIDDKVMWTTGSCRDLKHFICENGTNVCPDTWIPSMHSGSCIKPFHLKQSWTRARKRCIKLGGADLVVIADEYMNQFVADTVEEYSQYWLGLIVLQKTGKVVWLDDQKQVTYTAPWHPNQDTPDNSGICVTMQNNGRRQLGFWSKITCSSRSNFICEKMMECNDGTYGLNCSNFCSYHCGGPRGACSTRQGLCLSGCMAGYQGARCEKQCEIGKYGSGCSKNCSQRCFGQNRTCDAENGVCFRGCVSGFSGYFCDVGFTEDDNSFGLLFGVASFTAALVFIGLMLIASAQNPPPRSASKETQRTRGPAQNRPLARFFQAQKSRKGRIKKDKKADSGGSASPTTDKPPVRGQRVIPPKHLPSAQNLIT